MPDAVVIGKVAVKHCPRCQVTKDRSEYNISNSRYDGLNGWCRACQRADRVAKKAHYQDYEMRRRYGVGLDTYDRLYQEQAGTCAICHEGCIQHEALSIDHDHATGQIRGLLCGRCNQALGLLREDPDLFASAVNYLAKGVSVDA